jgi:hypothetical protein
MYFNIIILAKGYVDLPMSDGLKLSTYMSNDMSKLVDYQAWGPTEIGPQ